MFDKINSKIRKGKEKMEIRQQFTIIAEPKTHEAQGGPHVYEKFEGSREEAEKYVKELNEDVRCWHHYIR